MILALNARTSENEQAKVLGISRLFWNRLCANDTLARGEVDIHRRMRPQPQCALQRKNVRRVRHDFGRARRREDTILMSRADDRAGSDRRDRREFDSLEALCGRQQVAVDGQHRTQVDGCRHTKGIAAVLSHKIRRAARQRARMHHFEQKRLDNRPWHGRSTKTGSSKSPTSGCRQKLGQDVRSCAGGSGWVRPTDGLSRPDRLGVDAATPTHPSHRAPAPACVRSRRSRTGR